MFRRRSTLQRRDRDSGLSFNWRVPVSSAMTFVSAFLIVGSIAVLLAAGVKVRVGKERQTGERRAGVTVVPPGAMADRLIRMAKEAGPFPFDGLIGGPGREGMDEVAPLSVANPAYLPDLKGMGGEPDEKRGEPGETHLQVLPPLPGRQEIAGLPEEREVALGMASVSGEGGETIEVDDRKVPVAAAGQWVGRRFLIEYDTTGRIVDSVPLAPGEDLPEARDWLRGGRVTDGGNGRRWLVVECVREP